MPSILDKLMGRKKVDELDAAIDEIEDEIKVKEKRVVEVRGQIASAAFDAGADRVRELQREARDLEDEIVVLKSVAGETLKRRELAEIEQRRTAVEKRQADGRGNWSALTKAWADYDRLVTELSDTLVDIQSLTESVRIGNEFARSQGFEQLQYRLPGTNFGTLTQALGQLRQSVPTIPISSV